jgi:hypothetical protein
MPGLNEKKGRGVFGVLTTSDDIDKIEIDPKAKKMVESAEKSVDKKNIINKNKKRRSEATYARTYRVKESNVIKMDELKDNQNSSYNWMVNCALTHWFKSGCPNPKS